MSCIHVKCANGHVCLVPVAYLGAMGKGYDILCRECEVSVRLDAYEIACAIASNNDKVVKIEVPREQESPRINTYTPQDREYLGKMHISLGE